MLSALDVSVNDCRVEGNEALFWGGGLSADASSFSILGGEILENSTVGDGGAGFLLESTGSIDQCEVRDNEALGSAGGLHVESGGLTIQNGVLAGNGLAILASNDVVNARHNWWGHDSGPYHPADNPDGQGDAVSDHVVFEPWAVVAGLSDRESAGLRLTASWVVGGIELRCLLPTSGPARLLVYDATGRRLGTLLRGIFPPGRQVLTWSGRDARDRRSASGIYLFRLETTAGAVTTRSLLLH